MKIKVDWFWVKLIGAVLGLVILCVFAIHMVSKDDPNYEKAGVTIVVRSIEDVYIGDGFEDYFYKSGYRVYTVDSVEINSKKYDYFFVDPEAIIVAGRGNFTRLKFFPEKMADYKIFVNLLVADKGKLKGIPMLNFAGQLKPIE
jgi:uncharacterized membrane protein